MKESECKGCSASVHVSMEQIAAMLERMAATGNFALATDEVYSERLRACRTCPAFTYGTTCIHCGCIMQIKAKMSEAACPYPGHSRWLNS